MKARVNIFYKDSVFDPQGNTILGSLQRMGFEEIEDVRIGKVVDIQFKHTDRSRAETELKNMCENLLANPVIESYRFEIES